MTVFRMYAVNPLVEDYEIRIICGNDAPRSNISIDIYGRKQIVVCWNWGQCRQNRASDAIITRYIFVIPLPDVMLYLFGAREYGDMKTLMSAIFQSIYLAE